jgi:hypothetical protein
MLCIVGILTAISVPLLTTIATAHDHKTDKPVTQPTPTNTPTATPTYDAQKAEVNAYYNAFKQRDYATAYNMSHMNDANSNPEAYCGFVAGYAGMVDNSITIDGAEPLNDASSVQKYGMDAVRVDITITATEMGSQGETHVSTYQQYQVVQNGKIVGGGDRNSNKNGMVGTPTVTVPPQTLTKPDTTHTLAQQVQEVAQEQYDYLNRKDYQDAYNMWSKVYQSTTSFCSFLLSRVQVQHFAIQVGNVSDPGDGTEDVPVTVTETVGGVDNAPNKMVYSVEQNSVANTWSIMQAVSILS